ncbi:cation transporter [Paludibacter sp. 221]|uniref:cation transporter n=1 Tax=Paludibacter sp. 221 TaxID=2302939 RepID=UPI0013D31913|nr:heavy-metal-associated domain-containing protein [Paludibacter sp. 221]NDV47580.1 cation transporter [Paludibacter sp. 221]
MKTKSIILSVIMLMSFAGLSAQSKKDSNKEKVVFNVSMHCQSCANKIEKNIAFEKGVKDLNANLEKQTVAVTYDKRKTDVPALQAAFKKIGYEATLPDAACCAEGKKANCKHGEAACTPSEGKSQPADCPSKK